jgi:hypothetical protein
VCCLGVGFGLGSSIFAGTQGFCVGWGLSRRVGF